MHVTFTIESNPTNIMSWLQLRRENNLKKSAVMVTAGANQVITFPSVFSSF